jgi:uncharacterized phage protein (TIGR02220 family)
MAENKKSFVLYADLIKSIEHLTNEEKGVLFNHLLEYVNDKNPILEDRLVLTAWKPIELQLKRDLVKFEEGKAKRSEAGKRSAELRALKVDEQTSTNPTSVESVQQTSTNSTVNDTDNVNVNDNVINNNIIEPINWPVLLDFFNKTTGKKCKVVPKKAKEQFNARLKEGFTKVDIANAIVNASNDEYHIKEDLKYITLEFISRADKLDKFSQIKNELGTTNQKLMKYDDSGQIL